MIADDFALYDAAYVLGALSPYQRREFETHLKDCARCTERVSQLAGLPGLMSRVSVEQLTAEAEPVPATLLPSMARVERRRRRLAVGATAAAAACLIVVGAVAITRPDPPARPVATSTTSTTSSHSGTTNLALTAVAPSSLTASARLVDMVWGTRIDLTCVYRANEYNPASEISYALFVVDRGGAAERVATWKPLPDRELTVTGASSRARRDIAAVEVRTLSGLVILRLST